MIDLNFFLGDDYPETVIKRFHQYLNGYSMQPFWTMGYHQSRTGYKNLDRLKEVVKGFEENDIPIDGEQHKAIQD